KSPVAFSPDGKLLAVGDRQGQILLRDVAAQQEFKTAEPEGGRGASIDCLAFSRDGRLLVAGVGEDIILWDVIRRAEALRWRGHRRTISSVALTPDGKSLITGSDDKTVKVWNLSRPPVFANHAALFC